MPKEISKVTYANAAYDGGSIIIEFEDTDSSPWRILYNKNISDIQGEKYKTLSIVRICNKPDEVEFFIHAARGSAEEEYIISLLRKYKEADGGLYGRDWAKAILKDKARE